MQPDDVVQKTEASQIGQIQIADEVIAIIAGLAAAEVEGVHGMSGNFTGDIVEKLGKKNLAKGVKVEVGDTDVSIHMYLIISYGYKIPEIAEQVQQKVKGAIETMTGLTVVEVNLHIAGLYIEKQNPKDQNLELDVYIDE